MVFSVYAIFLFGIFSINANAAIHSQDYQKLDSTNIRVQHSPIILNSQTGLYEVDTTLTLSKASMSVVKGPVFFAISKITSPNVSVVNADGIRKFGTSDFQLGVPYFQFEMTAFDANGMLKFKIIFNNPTGESFDFTGHVYFKVKRITEIINPEISVTQPTDGEVVNTTTPTIQISFSGGLLGVDLDSFNLSLNGVDVTTNSDVTETGATYTPSSALDAGENTILSSVKNILGNSASVTSSFTVSGSVFRAMARCAPSKGIEPLTVRYRSSGEYSSGSIVKYQWDFDGDGTYETNDSVSRNYDRTYTTPGSFESVLQVTNNIGEVATDSCTITVEAPPPVASATVSPSNGSVPLAVTFTGTGSKKGGTIVLHEWDFDGDGVFDISTTDFASGVNHTYAQEGSFGAIFRVTDDSGATAIASVTTTAIRVGPPGSPSVTATATPTQGVGPLSVDFSGSATDDGNIVKWEWDFDGDGVYDYSSATTATTSFIYQSAGVFVAALRATDNDGLFNSALVEIIVENNVSLSLTTDTFDPDSGNTVQINTTLGAGSDIKLLLKDNDGNIVRNLVQSTRVAGSYEDIWDGKDDSGVVLPEGTYYAILEYQSGGDMLLHDLTNTTGGGRYNPSRSRIPRTFSPFAGQPMTVDYTLSKASEVTAFIGRFNVNTRLITFFERVPMGRGSHRLTWNGENADGQLIHPPPGDRFLFGIWGYYLPDNAIYLQSGAHVSDLSISPPILDPTGYVDDQGTPRRSVISFDLSKAANVELTVADTETGHTFVQRSVNGLVAGVNTIEWDGKDDDGVYVAPGRYRLGVAAYDDKGFRSLRIYALQRVYY